MSLGLLTIYHVQDLEGGSKPLHGSSCRQPMSRKRVISTLLVSHDEHLATCIVLFGRREGMNGPISRLNKRSKDE